MIRTVVAVAALCVLSAEASADQTDLTRRLTPTVKSLAKSAEQAELAELLVIARAMKGSTLPPAILPAIRDVVKEILEDEGLTVLESTDAEMSLGDKSDRRLLECDDVLTLQQETEFDALVTIDARRTRQRLLLRIALIDPDRRRFVRTVRLADIPKPVLKPTTNLANNPSISGNELANALGSIPGLSDGASGFRKTGTGTGTATTGTANTPTGETPAADGRKSNTQQKPSTLNQAIVRFAVSQLGKKVGNGECWTLAAEALEAAGAEPPKMYDFGEEIELSEITPGDILQFTSARFDRADGGYVIMGTPNHTAIVYAINGDQVFVLHQNFGQKIVTVLDINFDNMTSGSVQAYRAVPKDSTPAAE